MIKWNWDSAYLTTSSNKWYPVQTATMSYMDENPNYLGKWDKFILDDITFEGTVDINRDLWQKTFSYVATGRTSENKDEIEMNASVDDII